MTSRPFWFLKRAARMLFKDPSRASLTVRMAFTYALVGVAARFLPLDVAFRRLTSRSTPARTGSRSPAEIVSTLDTLLGANVPGLAPKCWRRAAVLHRYLHLEGIDTQIVLGVTTLGGDLASAHAWVERDGAPIGERAPVDAFRRVHVFRQPKAADA